MTKKSISIQIDSEKREAFQQKVKADGLSMSELIKTWIDEYLEQETVKESNYNKDNQELWERIEKLEAEVKQARDDQAASKAEDSENLYAYIQYLEQRIDTLETVVITPLQNEFDSLKKTSEALFNQVRGLTDNLNDVRQAVESLQQKNQQQMGQLVQYIKQQFKQKE
ncbi:MAG: ribbon-helix-helix protein, CopG family [Halothece sp.]